MRIICPKCDAKYVVKPEAVGEKGKKVKCTKCNETWFQEPQLPANKKSVAKDPDGVNPMPKGSSLPTVQEEENEQGSFGIKACGIVILLIIFGSSWLYGDVLRGSMPFLSGYFNAIGITDTSGITIYDVYTEKIKTKRGRRDVVVMGLIVNESDEDKILPDMRIDIFDDSKHKMKTVLLNSQDVLLAPGEEIEFQNKIPNIRGNADKLVIDVGNGLGLLLR